MSSPPPTDSLTLLVIGETQAASHALPVSGTVLIGSDPECAVIIADPSVTARHAILRIEADPTLEDLGTSEGTYVGELRLPPRMPVPVAPGDLVRVGSVKLLLQRRAAPFRARRVWNHGYFEGRLAEECARAARSGSGFAVVRIHLLAPVESGIVEETLADVVRTVDVVGTYGPGEFELLLVDTDPPNAEKVIGRMTDVFLRRGLPIRTGMACYPRDGKDPDELESVACAGARGSHAGISTGSFVVEDRTMKELHVLVERIASSNISVLILGETGVGKEIFAERLHRKSPRADHPFLRLNCAALTETLLESELFGHERGAFTGAVAAKPGLLETANGGTVFLDEIGELPLSTQVKLLRVLEERQVLRVGGVKSRAIDVRFVAATNRNLEAEVLRGAFRQDLYYRLNGISVSIPPLRQRVSEIEGLARAFIKAGCRGAGRTTPPELAPETLEALIAYRWPGNIRELRNVMERAVLLCSGDIILPAHLPIEKMGSLYAGRAEAAPVLPPTQPPAPAAAAASTTSRTSEESTARTKFERPSDGAGDDAPSAVRLRREVKATERRLILDALDRCGGNQTEAARLLGMSRRTLLYRLDELDIPRPRKGRTRLKVRR